MEALREEGGEATRKRKCKRMEMEKAGIRMRK
jgi:hypothetical protein